MTIPIQLERYYRERGIYPAAGPDFKCRHVADCRPNGMRFTPLGATLSSKWRDTFTPGHSAMVGRYYEKASPRILFVALDLGTVLLDEDRDYSYVRPESRGPAAIRKNHERMVSLVLAGKAELSARLCGARINWRKPCFAACPEFRRNQGAISCDFAPAPTP